MRDSKVGYWLQVGANVGILAGLILVFLQIRQSNEITAAEMFSASLESTVARELALIGETPEESMTRLMLEPESATPVDHFVAERIYSAIWRQTNRALVLSSADLYGTQDGIDAFGFVAINYSLFACPYGLAWLDAMEETIGDYPGAHLHMAVVKRYRELASAEMMASTIQHRREAAEQIRRQLQEVSGKGS